jgi:hypothetical protein
MKIIIENVQGAGEVDYSDFLDASVAPRIERKLNRPSTFKCSLAGCSGFVAPGSGSRIKVMKADGALAFTGYLTHEPEIGYMGMGERGPAYRYRVVASSDEFLLDAKALPNRTPYISRTAGSALKQLLQDLLPGAVDTSAVQDVGVLPSYAVNPQKQFSEHAGAIASMARGSYRVINGQAVLDPVGSGSHEINESDPEFSASGLELSSTGTFVNDVTVIGLDEPQGYVRDYFVGDGLSRSFYLSQAPFQQSRRALIDEQYRGADLDSSIWNVSDPASVLGVGAQGLQVSGGTGQDGGTTVRFIEQIELGGALELQHGEVSFSATSRGVIGGLYAGRVTSLSCVAGFQITPSGAGSKLQALINGAATGPVITTTAGHRYLLTTYVYSREVYRSGETYYSSAHPAGAGRGGEVIPTDVRIVLEVQEINPSDISSLLAPATVLFDDVIVNAPGFCSYALVNATDMQCTVTSTYASHIAAAEVRTALPNSNYKTVLVESLVDGGQCYIASSASLDFYPQYVPPLNALIVASYRGYGRAIAEVADDEAIEEMTTDGDNGVRGLVTMLKVPAARTQADCENAALALIDDLGSKRWAGTYKAWSDFLPGGARDTFPGDVVVVNVPSRDAQFQAVVRSVQIEYRDPANDRGVYSIEFANDAAAAISLVTEASATAVPLQDLPVRLGTTQVGNYYPANLVNAQVTEVTSTTVQVDVGMSPGGGSGIEVRTRDFGWGSSNDRTFLGRFSARTFTLPRLGRTQTYFLRLYDSSSPTRYSRYAAVLHVDYPLGYAL